MADPQEITTELPPHIQLFHILPRLPAKSVLRCMCVSKQWRSFLKTPMFAKMHLHHVTNDDHDQNHHKLLFLSSTKPCKFSTMDCEAPEDGLTVIRSLPFEAAHVNMRIIACLHGLVCVGIVKRNYVDHRYSYSDVILWNPLTGEHKALSKHKECYDSVKGAFGLCYSSSDQDYKLLCITEDRDSYMYSLKSDSWRKVGSIADIQRRSYLRDTAALNEKLYFLKQVVISDTLSHYSITRFDIKTERFTEIRIPSFKNHERAYCLGFTVVKGSIHLYVGKIEKEFMCNNVKTELWRMDGEGDWSRVGSYNNHPVSRFNLRTVPLHVMRNGNWLMHSRFVRDLYKLDPKRLVNKYLCSYAATDIASNMDMVNPRRGKFIETLVSPNQYINLQTQLLN